MPSLRVLHTPSLVGGNAAQLARAEREVGLDSRAIGLVGSPFGYEADEILAPPGAGFRRREAARWLLLWRALRKFDVIHFNFGSSILPARPARAPEGLTHEERTARARAWALYARLLAQRDLPLLRAAGKVIAVTYQGSDARQADVIGDLRFSPAAEVEPGYYPPGSDSAKRAAIRGFDRHADLIYALNPDLMRALPQRARFLPYANVELGPAPAARAPGAERPVIAHAPTNRGVKGTRHLLAALETLREEGLDFELMLIEGISHEHVKERLAQADLLVDQLLIGWYGGVAVEAMAAGTPVAVYIREEDLHFVPEAMRTDMPVIRTDPESLTGVLREWLGPRRHELAEHGRAGRAYVERWHRPRDVAARLKADYEGALSRRRAPPPPSA